MGAAVFLERIRVVEFAQYIPGPLAGQILADLGADVVKTEPPGGEPMRRLGPPGPDGASALYALVNRGKRVLELDLKAEEGVAAFAALLENADVLLESYRPGVLARLGFDDARLDALNPRLVHCALTGWGRTGPYAGRAGHDLNYMALGGGLAASGPAAAPAISHPPVADHAGASAAAVAILAALVRRGQTGTGAHLDVSLMESVLAWQATALTLAARGAPPERGQALLNGGAAFYNVYETADGGFVTLGAIEAKFWAAFCDAVGRPGWIARQAEPLPQTELNRDVATLFAARPLADWCARLDPVDCCFEAVARLDSVAQHPHVAARGLLREQQSVVETLFPLLVDGAPVAERAPVRMATAADVLADWD